MCGLESLPLNRGVGDEAQVHLVARGDKWFRSLAAAQPTQDGGRVAVTVKGLQVVVRTLLVLLYLKLTKGLETRRRRRERQQRE